VDIVMYPNEVKRGAYGSGTFLEGSE